MKTEKIGLIVAMGSEAAPIIEALTLDHQKSIYPETVPFETYTGLHAGRQISLTVSGRDDVHGIDNVGTQAAALMTWLAIEHFKPELIINAGTAGGMADKGCEVGDVYLSETPFCFHDRRIPIPRFREYGLGSYPSMDTTDLASSLGFKRGRISTGDSLDMTKTDLEKINANGAIIKEMEAAAIAWVCRMTQTPMFAVKVITDLIDRRVSTQKQFTENLKPAVDNLQKSIRQIVEIL